MIKYDMLRYKEHFTFVVSYFCIDPKFVRMFMISRPEFQTDNIPVIYYVIRIFAGRVQSNTKFQTKLCVVILCLSIDWEFMDSKNDISGAKYSWKKTQKDS